MTDADFTAWLIAQSAVRCVLVEVTVDAGAGDITRYLSSIGYTTSPSDSPSNQFYSPVITGGIEFTETISQSNRSGLQFGDIELSNHDGSLDGWLDDVWVNRDVTVYIGDVNWPRADFRVIFSGIVADIDTRNRNVLNIKLRDKLQRLNNPLTSNKLGGSSSSADRLIPLAFGECPNVKPLLTDLPTHEYQFHDGASEGIIEVRDNGVPVVTTDYLATGKFTLSAQPAGEITTSVQGDKQSVYNLTAAKIIEKIVKDYGSASTQFTAGDIDSSNLSTFDAANQQSIGLYVSERMTVLDAIQRIAGSIGAQVVMSREGLMQLIKIDLPATGPVMNLTSDKMLENQLDIVSRTPVIASVKIGYCRNYTTQPNLQTGIPEDHKELFDREWITVTATDSAVATKYKLSDEPVQKDTLMLETTDANAEATRLLNLNKVPISVYRFTGFAELFDLRLGDSVTITHDRFGLTAGKTGMIVELRPNWMTSNITVGVLM